MIGFIPGSSTSNNVGKSVSNTRTRLTRTALERCGLADEVIGVSTRSGPQGGYRTEIQLQGSRGWEERVHVARTLVEWIREHYLAAFPVGEVGVSVGSFRATRVYLFSGTAAEYYGRSRPRHFSVVEDLSATP